MAAQQSHTWTMRCEHCSNHQMQRTPSEPSANKPPPPSTRCLRTPQGRGAPGGARHGGGNRAMTSQPRAGQSTSYGDVKSAYGGGGGGRVGQEWVHKRGTQERQQTGGGATQTHRTREPHQEGQGRAEQARRRGTARHERQRGQGTRMEGMGERGHGRQRQHRGWPGQPAPSLPGARATPAQPASGGGCLPQPTWAVCSTRVGAHQRQTSQEGEKDIWWTIGATRGGAGHLSLTHTETQRGSLWTACGQRRVDSKNSQTTPATTSTTSIHQLLSATDAQTAHHATSSTVPAHQPLGSTNAETTPARAPAAAADRKQRPDATCEGKNG